ncbi:hypothetical protein SteCoe_18510 [Stentor coeruleus]|uniref:SKP1 component dimerisation domain-containing protein n=1 Tax=Stentor coeruleus TaxID=5963 RepID=A0A1R2BWC9_9CILI|nr:hypothetical protein SteCoe_18510 [Stentor coeruleus]
MHRPQISIISSEGRQVSVNGDFVKVLKIPITNGVLHMPNTHMPAIHKIIEFAQKHGYKAEFPVPEQPLKSHEMKKVIDNEWVANFFANINVGVVVEMINACEFIGFKNLSVMCQAYLATLFKSLNIEELKEIFHVDEEFDDVEAQEEYDRFVSN